MTDLPGVTLHQGHVLDVLAGMEPESVHAVVTSPPYWGLRKYSGEQDQVWGGRKNCDHAWEASQQVKDEHYDYGTSTLSGSNKNQMAAKSFSASHTTCSLCGGWRGALGLEPTPDLFIEHLMKVMAALWRVLRRDGVCWVNLDDTRASSPSGNPVWNNWRTGGQKDASSNYEPRTTISKGLKPKDMALIPERFVLAAQSQGWYVRSKTIWALPNPMPESCTDRPSDAYQVVYMLVKSEHYWYDQEAVREKNSLVSLRREEYEHRRHGAAADKSVAYGMPANVVRLNPNGHNLRNVWTFPTRGQGTYRVNGKTLAHFAAFPPELPRRAILASCPPYVCAECGAPWVREVTKPDASHEGDSATKYDGLSTAGRLSKLRQAARARGEEYHADRQTLGWSPTCSHTQPEKELCPAGTVLDPFCGSGTTLMAARALGRRAIGIDLSPDYIALTRHRLERVMAPLYPVTEATVKESLTVREEGE